MKILSEKKALEQLDKIKTIYREKIQSLYEIKAKNCTTCETKGACCLDEHFVNVHITRLEAVAMGKVLRSFDVEKQQLIQTKIEAAITKYNLKDSPDSFSQTFACPLFEKETGCLVHQVKPVPCIQHACYERRQDLPPDSLQTETETAVEHLNEKAYGRDYTWLPLPVWLAKINLFGKKAK